LIHFGLGLALGASIGYIIGFNLSQAVDCQEASLVDTTLVQQSESVWDVVPLQHTEKREIVTRVTTDAYNPFMHYYDMFWEKRKPSPVDFEDLPNFHTWIHFLEPYHNHFHRFRGRNVVFMEIGVQSGGKIPLLRHYFGSGLQYVGIDINPSTKSKFESADWVHIEIGDSANTTFLAEIRKKYPHVDILLDDGGHEMHQQIIAMKELLPHVQPEGVYMCEDLATSWTQSFGGIPGAWVNDPQFLLKTMVGFVHQTLDWLQYGWIRGHPLQYSDRPDGFFGEEHREFWRIIPNTVKHIHYYNQLVVYEKGLTYKPRHVRTVGTVIPYKDSGV
jgi:hypothetical protein